MEEKQNINLKDEIIDPLEKPAHLKDAIIHGRAQTVFNEKLLKDAGQNIFCKCCNNLSYTGDTNNYKYNLFIGIKNLAVTGSGTYLYYVFFVFSIYALFITTCMVSIPQIITSYFYYWDLINYCSFDKKNNFCSSYIDQDKTEWLNSMTSDNLYNYYNIMLNKQEDMVVNYCFLNGLCMIVIFITNLFLITDVYNDIIELDFFMITPSDYTLMISNIPKYFKDEDELKYDILGLEERNQNHDNHSHETKMENIVPHRINLCYSLKSYITINKRLDDAEFKYSYCLNNNKKQYITGFCSKKIEEIESIKQDMVNNRKELEIFMSELENNKIKKNELFSGVVLATFKNGKDYEEYYDSFAHSLLGLIFKTYIPFFMINYICSCCFDDKRRKKYRLRSTLQVEVAPEPNDIIWENLEYSSTQRLIRILWVYFSSILLIGISFGIIIGLNYFQYGFKSSNKAINYGVSILISFCISVINFLITMLLKKLSEFEKNTSLTNHELTMTVKLSIFLFINSAIVPLVSNIITKNESSDKEILINNIFVIFISNAVVTPLLWFFNFYLFYLKIKRKSITQEKLDNLPIKMTQRQLNTLFENPSIDFYYKFSYICKTLLMSFFYIPIFPSGVMISLAGLFIGYCIEKYNILRNYKKPNMPNDKLGLFLFINFKFIIFVYSIGDYVFMDRIFQSRWSLGLIITFGLICLLPLSFFKINLVKISESEVLSKEYEDVYFDFYTDYERSNPITKKSGYINYITKLKEKKFINDNQYKKLLDKLNNNKLINLLKVYKNSDNTSKKKTFKFIKNKNDQTKSDIQNPNSGLKFNKNNLLFYLQDMVDEKNNPEEINEIIDLKEKDKNLNENNDISIQNGCYDVNSYENSLIEEKKQKIEIEDKIVNDNKILFDNNGEFTSIGAIREKLYKDNEMKELNIIEVNENKIIDEKSNNSEEE